MEKRSEILGRWFDAILDTYPADTASFLKNQKDRFHNPVGYTIYEGIAGIFDEIIKEAGDFDGASPFLDNIIRIRAIQDFAPSSAVSFVVLLKRIIRDELKAANGAFAVSSEELSLLDSKIDNLVLLSFDIYMGCRERLYEIKANEVKRNTFRLLQRAKLICEAQEDEPGLDDNNQERKEVTK
ncbi:MAG: RsbRD N-terminal domain-containing protein [Nitrospirae bacterium]|nr:RsbRD N-terminal domain-containing protein [Nitrospirota bacterium]